MVTKPCYVGEGFTRKPPKFERFIRPMVTIPIYKVNIPFYWMKAYIADPDQMPYRAVSYLGLHYFLQIFLLKFE